MVMRADDYSEVLSALNVSCLSHVGLSPFINSDTLPQNIHLPIPKFPPQ